MLHKAHATVAVGESDGRHARRAFTTVPGSSRYFLGGFLTYSNAMKVELLGVDPQLLAHFGAVSPETAEAMALVPAPYQSHLRAGRHRSSRPESGEDAAPVGTVYVALADPEKTVAVHRQFLATAQESACSPPDGARCAAQKADGTGG